MKEAIKQQPDKSVGQVYHEQQNLLIEQMGSVEVVSELLPQLSDLESGLIKHKRKFVPIIPTTIDQIEIIDEWKLCVDGKRFLAYHQKLSNDKEKPPMLIFASDIGIKILSKSSKWNGDGTFNQWFKKIIALSLLPPSTVCDVFEELLLEMHDLFDLDGEFKELETFADYVLLNYIVDDSHGPVTFPIQLWNHCDTDERTNNDVEAYNYRLNTVIGPHKNIWVFIKKIKTEEGCNFHKIFKN